MQDTLLVRYSRSLFEPSWLEGTTVEGQGCPSIHRSLPRGLNFLLGIPAERLRSLRKRCSVLTGLASSNDWCTIAVHNTEAKSPRASPPPPTIPPFLSPVPLSLSLSPSLSLSGWHVRHFAKKLSVCLHCALNDMSIWLLNWAHSGETVYRFVYVAGYYEILFFFFFSFRSEQYDKGFLNSSLVWRESREPTHRRTSRRVKRSKTCSRGFCQLMLYCLKKCLQVKGSNVPRPIISSLTSQTFIALLQRWPER